MEIRREMGRAIGPRMGLTAHAQLHMAREPHRWTHRYIDREREATAFGRILYVRRSLSVSCGDSPAADGRGWTFSLKGAGELQLSALGPRIAFTPL